MFLFSQLLHICAVAYIDPATTSYLIEIVVGIAIAIGTAFGIYRSKIKRAFRKKTEDDAAESPAVRKKNLDEKDTVTAEDLLGDDET